MRLVKHEAPQLNLALEQVAILCPFCRVTYKFERAETGIYSHPCADSGDKVYFLNGFAWSGVYAYVKSERPRGR